MKFLSFLLGILILLLSCIPCSDAGACTIQQETAEHTATGKTEHKHNTAGVQDDICSPFCQCACCAIAYALPVWDIIPMVVPAGNHSLLFAGYLQQRPVGMVLPVWQPPRLV